ncbi:hypothetical protein HPP92_027107 [Vanilla planifolia]|nr:hypothetical protein HPP92_027107 [Vanilla planifolia]
MPSSAPPQPPWTPSLPPARTPELPVRTTLKHEFRPIHMAARLDTRRSSVVSSPAGVTSTRTDAGETAIMLASRYKHGWCLKVLALSGADFGPSTLPVSLQL